MARASGLGISQVGVGQAAPQSVTASALKRPEQFTDGLRVHVQDPLSAHPATAISIVDAGGYYTSHEVEGALQEIGAGAAGGGGRQNGVLTGCGWTPAGLDITFVTPSHVARPNIVDISGLTVSLTNNNVNWVYVNGTTGVLTKQVGGSIPSITSPENVLLYKFTTSGGAITASEDLRLYVRNIDRKLPFTVRSSGAQDDQESEACFVTLDAAFNYLKYMSVPLGSSRRTEVVIRGDVSVAGPLQVPVDGLQIRGEDNAKITLLSGSSLFDMNEKSNVSFTDLELVTNTTPAAAIYDNGAGTPVLNLSLTRVRIESGTADWTYGLDLGNTLSAQVSARDCVFEATLYGAQVTHTTASVFDGCRFTAPAPAPGSVALELGDATVLNTDSASTVRDCTFYGFTSVGAIIKGQGHQVSGCSFGGMDGAAIQVETATDVVIHGNRINAQGSISGTGVFVYGLPGEVRRVTVAHNEVYGATNYGIAITGDAQEITVDGNQVDCIIETNQPNPTGVGIYVDGTVGFGLVTPKYITITGNHVWRGQSGIVAVSNPAVGPVSMTDITVSGNSIQYCAKAIGAPVATVADFCSGISVEYARNVSVVGNEVSYMGSILDLSGAVVQPVGDIYPAGISMHYVDRASVSSNQVHDLTVAGAGFALGVAHYVRPTWLVPGVVVFETHGNIINDNTLQYVPGIGILSYYDAVVTTTMAQTLVVNNTVLNTNTGIQVISEAAGSFVGQVRVEGNIVEAVLSDYGIEVFANAGTMQQIAIVNNTVADVNTCGIYAHADTGALTEVQIKGNQLSNAASGIGSPSMLIEGTAPSAFEQFAVEGNTVDDPTTILVSVLNTTSGISNLHIDRNHVKGTNTQVASVTCVGDIEHFSFCGNTSASAEYGLNLSASAGALRYAAVNGNVLGGNGTATTQLISLDVANDIAQAQFNGNELFNCHVGVVAQGSSLDYVEVVNNAIKYDAFSSPDARGIYLYADTLDVTNVSVSQNNLVTTTGNAGGGNGNGAAILVEGSDAITVQVCDNTISSIGSLATYYGIRLLFSGSHANTKVDGNSVTEYEYATHIAGSAFDTVSASHNNIHGCLYCGIGLTYTLGSTNVSVCDNSVAAYGESAPAVQNINPIIYFNGGAGDNMDDCRVVGNAIRGDHGGVQHGGIALRFGQNATRVDTRGLVVASNNVAYTYRGFQFFTNEARNVNIQGNTLRNVFGHGIYFDSNTTSYNANVSGNTVEDWNDDTTGPTYYGIYLESGNSPSGSYTVTHNNLNTQNDNAYAYTFALQASPTFSGLVCSNNIALFRGSPTTTVALSIQTGGNGAAPSTNKNFSFMGNVFRGSSAGILYVGVANDKPDYCTFYGNIGDNSTGNSWSQFASGGTAGWTNVLPLAGVFTSNNIDDGS
jgi:hypothetical protein